MTIKYDDKEICRIDNLNQTLQRHGLITEDEYNLWKTFIHGLWKDMEEIPNMKVD